MQTDILFNQEIESYKCYITCVEKTSNWYLQHFLKGIVNIAENLSDEWVDLSVDCKYLNDIS